MVINNSEMQVKSLGPCRLDSPLSPLLENRKRSIHNVDEHDRVLFDDTVHMAVDRGSSVDTLPGFEPAGPRKKIFFDPSKTRVGVVTCGGLCPGLNDVIRGLVMELTFHYGVKRIYGFKNGYQGFIARYGRSVIDLTPESVSGNCGARPGRKSNENTGFSHTGSNVSICMNSVPPASASESFSM